MAKGFKSLGNEFQINSYFLGAQLDPAVTGLAGGGYVVTWRSDGADGSGSGIRAQMYSVAGQKLGGEFPVNTYTFSNQLDPSITALAGGGFVISWSSLGQDGSFLGTYAQRYTESGEMLGSEFQVNTYTESFQQNSSVTGLTDGGFVVTWESRDRDGSGFGVYGQLYDNSGDAVGGEFLVNTHTASFQWEPSTTALADSSFVVTWASNGQDGSGFGVFSQLFNASGAKVGGEFQVNTYTEVTQDSPSVTALISGGFVVAWASLYQDGSSVGVYGQLFDAGGEKMGAEFQVNTYTDTYQENPSVTGLADGGFVVTWHSNGQDGSYTGIYGQRFNTDGQPVGKEFHVSTHTALSQSDPSVAALEEGGFVVTWETVNQDGSSYGVYGQQFAAQFFGSSDGEVMRGDASKNWINGQGGNDVLRGFAGKDTLFGGAGNDRLFGNNGKDKLTGGRGKDDLDGGKGKDVLTGGVGKDTFVFKDGYGRDRITDYQGKRCAQPVPISA